MNRITVCFAKFSEPEPHHFDAAPQYCLLCLNRCSDFFLKKGQVGNKKNRYLHIFHSNCKLTVLAKCTRVANLGDF
jgi:hypothetical protein